MIILALDIATKCGWAYGSIDTGIESGTWDFEPKSNESRGMRVVKFKNELRKFTDTGIGLIVFERITGQHKNALIVMAEMHGVLKDWAERLEIPYRTYTSSQIKLYATGNGRASKEDMCGAAIHKFGVDCEGDDNRADALALWHLAASEYGDGLPAAPRKTKAKGVRRKTKTTAA